MIPRNGLVENHPASFPSCFLFPRFGMMKRDYNPVPEALSSSSRRENVALEASGSIELQGLERSVDDRTRNPASALPRPDGPRPDDDDVPIKTVEGQRRVISEISRAYIYTSKPRLIWRQFEVDPLPPPPDVPYSALARP